MNETPVNVLEEHRQRMMTIKYRMCDLLEFGYGFEKWTAAQDDNKHQYWGQTIVLEGVFEREGYVDFFVPKEDFDLYSDTELALRFAEHIIGGSVGSPQDVERKKRYLQGWIDSHNQNIQRIATLRDDLIRRLELLTK